MSDNAKSYICDVGALLVILLVALLCSWARWADPIIDFGREIYIPWRLTTGEVLYRDLHYFNGPLSPYVNALWFRLWGANLQSLFLLNSLITAGTLALIYHLLRLSSSRLVGVLGGLSFVGLFAIAQFESIGNSNWIAPYSHEMTHGIALCLLSLLVWYRIGKYELQRDFVVAGLLLGLIFLTKAEVFLGALIAHGCAWCAYWRLKNLSRSVRSQQAATYLAAALCPALISCALFSLAMPVKQALLKTAGTWPYVFKGSRMQQVNYQYFMGTDTPMRNLLLVLGWLVGYGLGLVLVIITCRWLKARDRKNWSIPLGLLLGVLLYLSIKVFNVVNPLNLARPWLAIMGIAWLILAWKLIKRQTWAAEPVAILQVAGLSLAMALLAKLLLHVRIWHYGFGLAVPACLAVLILIFRVSAHFGVPQSGARCLGMIWLMIIAMHVQISAQYLSTNSHQLGSGVNQLYVDSRGPFLQAAAATLKDRLQPGDTLMVMPEGVLFNVLLRVPSPISYCVFDPGTVAINSEDEILREMKANPPDYILLVHRDNAEHGARFFGRDFGRDIAAWIATHYTFEEPIGAQPLTSKYFGVLIATLRVNESAP